MATLTFDTLAYAKKLKSAGFTEKQAEIAAEAQAEAIQNAIDYLQEKEFATKQDLELLKTELKRDIAEAKSDIIKWVVGVVVSIGVLQTGFIAALVLKLIK